METGAKRLLSTSLAKPFNGNRSEATAFNKSSSVLQWKQERSDCFQQKFLSFSMETGAKRLFQQALLSLSMETGAKRLIQQALLAFQWKQSLRSCCDINVVL